MAFLCSYFFFTASCNNSARKDEHPEYFNALYNRLNGSIQEIRRNDILESFDSVYNAIPNAGVGDLFVIDSLKFIAVLIVNQDYVKGLEYADTMMNIAADRLDKEKYAERYVVALYFKGDCYRGMKRYSEALQFYTIAREAGLKYVKDKCALVLSMGNLANMMYQQKKYRQAAAYFSQQHEDLLYNCKKETFELIKLLQGSLTNVALSYLKAGLYDSALYYQDSALRTIRYAEHKFPADYSFLKYAEGVVYGGMAEALSIQGKLSEAEEFYKQSIAAVGNADGNYNQSTQVKLAELYFLQGQTDSAALVLKELKTSLDTLPNEGQLILWHKLKVKYFVQHKETDSAFHYQMKYDSLGDLVVSRDSKFISTDLTQEFENLQSKYSNEILQKESNLKKFYLKVSAIVFLIAATIVIIVIGYNLRKAKKLNLQVQHKNDDLEKAFSSLEQSHRENSRIMKIVAHDLKNPISAVKNLASSLLKKDQGATQKNALEIIQDSCINSLALINDLLYEKKKLSQVRMEMVDMKKMVVQCVALLQAKANEKNQNLKLEAVLAFAFVNSEEMWRVVSNIVNNAIKFSHPDTEINVRLEKQNNYVLFSVRDNGIGIPPEIADTIFSISEEAGRTGTSGEKSHGLGLSISQKIIAEHEGKIWFESEEGKGSIFFVRLPVAD
jgi:signal transduction histidine kinase